MNGINKEHKFLQSSKLNGVVLFSLHFSQIQFTSGCCFVENSLHKVFQNIERSDAKNKKTKLIRSNKEEKIQNSMHKLCTVHAYTPMKPAKDYLTNLRKNFEIV